MMGYNAEYDVIGRVSNSTNLIANHFPFLDITYPITNITPNWLERKGLSAITNNPGKGYNQFGVIDRITPNEDGMHEVEVALLVQQLRGGFYL